MTLHRRLCLLAFIESFATILVERGIYFYTRERLGFSDRLNLLLALCLGLSMAVGAATSHLLARRHGERAVLRLAILGLALAHTLLIWRHGPISVFLGATLVSGLHGWKWPVIESFVGAGHSSVQASRAVGRFNMSWSVAVPLSVAASGWFIAVGVAWMFACAAALNLVALILLVPIPEAPPRFTGDHPGRPSTEEVAALQRILLSSRTLMWFSYAALYVLAAVMPRLLADLGLTLTRAAALASVVDLARLMAFAFFAHWSGWHGKSSPLVAAGLVLPVSFGLVIFAPSPLIAAAGEWLFGFSAGACYAYSLHGALVTRNSEVEAGGVHEALIGLGFAAGPLIALVGAGLGGAAGYAGSVGLLWAVCAGSAALALRRRSPAGRPPGA